MVIGKKKFRVTRVTMTKDDHLGGVILSDKIERRTRVILGEDGKDDGDFISITSYDGSLDCYDFKVGDVYEIALSRRPDAVPHETGVLRGAELTRDAADAVTGLGATHPGMTPGMTAENEDPAFMDDTVEAHEPGLTQGARANAPEDVPETEEQAEGRQAAEARCIPRRVPAEGAPADAFTPPRGGMD